MKFFGTIVLSIFCITLFGQINERMDVAFKDLMNPLTGGFEAPQFQSIHLNDDGKKDLLVFDRKGSAIRTFLYDEASPNNYVYVPEYEYAFPDIPCWVIVRDFDNDGVDDLFTCGVTDPVTGIEVWKGSRENGVLSFEAINHSNGFYNIIYYYFNGDYKQLYVGNNGIPGIKDIDGDGDVDILAFQPSGGYLYYFQNMSQEKGFENDSLLFERVDDCWGNFYEGGLIPDILLNADNESCALPGSLINSRHEGITLGVFDKNNDGLQDLLIGEVSSSNLIYVENGGTKTDAFATFKEVNFPSEDVPADLQIFLGSFIVDVDQDGADDVLVAPNSLFGTNTEQVSYYKNVDGSYQLIQEDWFVDQTLDFGTDSYPAFIDYNGDGLQDILIGTFGLIGLDGGAQTRLYLYENQGSAAEPFYVLVDDNYLNFLAFSEFDKSFSPSFGDIDGDEDLDLILGSLSGEVILVENTAGPGNPIAFGNPTFDYKQLDSENNTIKPDIADLNGDGLGEIIMGGRNSYSLDETIGSLKAFTNIGSAGEADFSNDDVLLGLGQVNVKDVGTSRTSAAPRFYQNGDETLLFVGNEIGRLAVYRVTNTEEPYELLYEDLLGEYFGRRMAVDIADIDDDGYLEIVAGNERGGLNFFNTVVQTSGQISSTNEENHIIIDVYPNPTSGSINFPKSEDKVLVYNNLGQFVLSANVGETTLDVSALPPGMYYLKSGNMTGKFLKVE